LFLRLVVADFVAKGLMVCPNGDSVALMRADWALSGSGRRVAHGWAGLVRLSQLANGFGDVGVQIADCHDIHAVGRVRIPKFPMALFAHVNRPWSNGDLLTMFPGL
jgi:hypothetical protein